MQNIKKLMFQVIFIFSDLIWIKQIIVSSIRFCCGGKQILERMVPWRMSNFLLPRAWWQELGGEFEWGGTWVEIPRINTFSRNVKSINWKIFPTHGGYKILRENSTSILERDKGWEVYRNMKGCILGANLEEQGW